MHRSILNSDREVTLCAFILTLLQSISLLMCLYFLDKLTALNASLKWDGTGP